ncbi:MAG: hypothetical protein IT350_17005, partial [Deltaproteobacteria bacterium]|nr:hypothetical protein [Deltaproteobacteria bacterium]
MGYAKRFFEGSTLTRGQRKQKERLLIEMSRLITDTNVWYDVASGSSDLQPLKHAGHRICATALNVWELISPPPDSKRSFSIRRDAAVAMKTHCDDVLEYPEKELLSEFGITQSTPSIDWKEILEAMQRAATQKELDGGIPDHENLVIRIVKSSWASQFRNSNDTGFSDDVIDMIEHNLSGYKASVKRGKVKALNAKQRTKMEEELRSEAGKAWLTIALFLRTCRVCDGFKIERPWPFPETLKKCLSRFEAYIEIYSQYCIRCASTGRAPK